MKKQFNNIYTYFERKTTLARQWFSAHMIYVFFLIFISVVRIYIGNIVPLRGNASAKNTLDDYLLIQYAQLSEHFHSQDQNIVTWALAKTMSFSYLLNFLTRTGISYSFFVSILWIVASLLTVSAIRRLWERWSASTAACTPMPVFAIAYCFLVFCPTAFDQDTGTRIYRESLTAPITLLIAGLCLQLVLSAVDAGRQGGRLTVRELWWGITLGCAWTFFWFLKESGIWLAPLFVIALIGATCVHWCGSVKSSGHSAIRTIIRRSLAGICVTVVPLVVFVGGDALYRAVNMHYFGVSYASVRTEGAIAGFFERLYAIDSADKTEEYWIPWSVVKQAINASPTLQKQTKLIENLRHSPFVDDEDGIWDKGPNHDMGVWAMIQALESSDMYPNQVEPQQLFEQINSELDQADLPKTKGFSFSGALVPKTLEDVWNLRHEWAEAFKSSVLWRRYVVADDDFSNLREDQNQRLRLIELTLNEVLGRYDDPSTSRYMQRAVGLKAAQIVVTTYKYLAPVLVCLAYCGLVAGMANIIRRKRNNLSKQSVFVLIATVAGGGSSFALTLAVSWLCSTRMETLVYYTAAIVPLVQIVEILGILLCAGYVTHWINTRSYQSVG